MTCESQADGKEKPKRGRPPVPSKHLVPPKRTAVLLHPKTHNKVKREAAKESKRRGAYVSMSDWIAEGIEERLG